MVSVLSDESKCYNERKMFVHCEILKQYSCTVKTPCRLMWTLQGYLRALSGSGMRMVTLTVIPPFHRCILTHNRPYHKQGTLNGLLLIIIIIYREHALICMHAGCDKVECEQCIANTIYTKPMLFLVS